VYEARTFNAIVNNPKPITLGRRGSGKTAFVAALLARSGRTHYYFDKRNGAPNKSDDIYVFIQSWDHLDDIINSVGHDCMHAMGRAEAPSDWDALLPETAARYWSRRLWHLVFQQIYTDSASDDPVTDYRVALPLVFKYMERGDIISPDTHITNEALNDVFEQTRQQVLAYLATTGRHCYVIIDSLDNYPVTSPRFTKVFSGLLRCAAEFSDLSPKCALYCCIPEEIESMIHVHCANELRDFSALSGVSRLHWRPYDLMRIVAERYRAFLEIHVAEDETFMRRLERFDFSKRDDLQKFYSLIMPPNVTNTWGKEEVAISYIVRHTQLLPREFILLFSEAIKLSHQMRGSWRYVEANAIVKAIQNTEVALSRQILKPYGLAYRELIRACIDTLPELPPICSLSDLDKIGSRMARNVVAETDNVWRTLYEMGVLGYIEDYEGKNSAYYEYGYFQFNSSAPITFANHLRYCIHPVFSGTWHLDRTPGMKFVYPAKIEDALWEN